MRNIILILAVILLISGAGCEPNIDVDEELAKCISHSSTLYISNSCPYCIKQEQMFGDNSKFLKKVDCTKEIEKCREAGIVSVPTWVINGEKFRGVQSIEKLKELTEC